MVDHIELLRLIEKNARLTPEEIAVMLDADAREVEDEIARLTEEKIILGYTTEINWEKTYPDHVTAMIEVRITPVRNQGFDHISNILSQYDKVTACYLMSGGFDLMLIYEDDNLKDIASFVYEKVATLEGVLSTATHFILRKYKANGIRFDEEKIDDRQAIVL
ncbi:MAG: Lrp/AsnC family transcriptional regulator [Clostridiales bacterium]|nr:Lrp/AsnC family transcriptional regulator [Clostridiales bacterium]